MSSAACLTPRLMQMLPCNGVVHSVFPRVANVLLTSGTKKRLLTLLPEGAAGVPDSIHTWRMLPLSVGQAVTMHTDTLHAGSYRLSFVQMGCEALRISPGAGLLRYEEFLQTKAWQGNGLEMLPAVVREAALAMLCTGNAQRWLGLGPGLTPAFDDACIGAMAICRAAGRPAPLGALDVGVTTDVSARYLTLAMEGYFSQAVCDVVGALHSMGAPLNACVHVLAQHGATSGRDTLYGMLQMMKHIFDLPKEHTLCTYTGAKTYGC